MAEGHDVPGIDDLDIMIPCQGGNMLPFQQVQAACKSRRFEFPTGDGHFRVQPPAEATQHEVVHHHWLGNKSPGKRPVAAFVDDAMSVVVIERGLESVIPDRLLPEITIDIQSPEGPHGADGTQCIREVLAAGTVFTGEAGMP